MPVPVPEKEELHYPPEPSNIVEEPPDYEEEEEEEEDKEDDVSYRHHTIFAIVSPHLPLYNSPQH